MIPKKIHCVYLNNKEPQPTVFKYCLNRIKNTHPDWEVNVYDMDSATRLIQEHVPYLFNWFDMQELTVQKADVFRIILVYIYGGFYMDMDMLCLKRLDDLASENLVLAEEKTISAAQAFYLGHTHQMRIANYMFGSKPSHPFWIEMLIYILENSHHAIHTEEEVLEYAGPGALTNIYHHTVDKFPDVKLLLNGGRICIQPGHIEESCYFGEYAAHIHQGSWRWQGNGNGTAPAARVPLEIFETAKENALQHLKSIS
ncbi:Glycosyltransferase sugar-binding region containing DXD motif-containing protein [Pedobacter terrae]|uniref:Glycosyltransferase sugar-binding region containing DXD motif-containing protein n=1 Tax=Pedobacter terrae TaxID=405671 RepID=A0A1G7NYS2_9SPHI|nr:glycosyltransferase [Pedobacter terrae]SDF79218.1 Glycosyltransferase sugar-binding region containing DXD motif-containing protein [Pedobacter terrae]